MKVLNLNSKSYLSTWLIILFSFALLVLLIFSEFFQNSTQSNKSLDLLSNPIRADILANIETIRIKNRLGSFMLSQNKNQWILKEPRVMPANTTTINKILETLKSVKIDTIHQHEPINIQNFSLDTPIMVIDLYSKLEESLQIKVGLINPINNTSYITVSGKKTIYQIELLKNNIQRLDLSDFIESSIFSTKISDLAEFSLYRRGVKESSNTITRKGDIWLSKKYKTVSNNSVINKLQKIFNIKTHMIVDKQDEKLQNFISNYIDNPLYTIKIKTINNKNITYKISTLIKALPELKLEKRHYFIMTSSDRQYPYIITKEYLSEFIIRYKDFR